MGVWRQAVVLGSMNQKCGPHRNQPRTELRPTGGVSTGEGEHSRPKAGSCYCESVWWVVPDGIGPSKSRPKAPASQPEHARGAIHRGVSPAKPRPAGRREEVARTIKSECGGCRKRRRPSARETQLESKEARPVTWGPRRGHQPGGMSRSLRKTAGKGRSQPDPGLVRRQPVDGRAGKPG